MAEKIEQRWLIAGHVQGIGCRAWLVRQARAQRLDGWVRNLPDGRVEAVVVGDAAPVARLYEKCLQGPPHGHVEKIEVKTMPRGSVASGTGFSQVSDGR